MRAFYSSLFYLIIPFIALRLLWRGIKAPDYLNRWHERIALYRKKYHEDVIWFHAVSVGETEALFPLIRLIQYKHPEAKLLITTTTPTGSARVTAALKNTVTHVYLPYDIPDAVSRFMHCFKPRLAVIMETEIWPNLYAYCSKNNIPLYLINARLSEKSAQGYLKLPALVHPALAAAKLIATQTPHDSQRFISIGASSEKVVALGNMKFDVDVSPEIIEQGLLLKTNLFSERFVWICASTHKDEERLCLEIYQKIKLQIPQLLLIIAPRHPERFTDVKKLCEQHHLEVTMRTTGIACQSSTDVYLADTLGELKLLYTVADIAFVGGSLVPVGGHNILEAIAAGVPVLFGPYMDNFKDIAQGVLTQGAAIQCQDKDAVENALLSLYSAPVFRKQLTEKAKLFVQQNKGAITRIYDRLAQDIS